MDQTENPEIARSGAQGPAYSGLKESLEALDSAMASAAKQVAAVRGLTSEARALLVEMDALDEALSQARRAMGQHRESPTQLVTRPTEAAPPASSSEPQSRPAAEIAPVEITDTLVLRVFATTKRGGIEPSLVEQTLARCRGVVDVKLDKLESRKAEWTVRLDLAKEPRVAKSFLRIAMDGLIATGQLATASVESREQEPGSLVA